MSRIDPHADIASLCDALAVLFLALHQNDLCEMTPDVAKAANDRLIALQDKSQSEILDPAVAIMARSRAVH